MARLDKPNFSAADMLRAVEAENKFLKANLEKLSRQLHNRDIFDMLLGNALAGAASSRLAAQDAAKYAFECAEALSDLLNLKVQEAVDKAIAEQSKLPPMSEAVPVSIAEIKEQIQEQKEAQSVSAAQ